MTKYKRCLECKKIQDKYHQIFFCSKHLPSVWPRDHQLLVAFSIMKIKDVAEKFFISNQRVSQIAQKYQEQGLVDFTDIILERKRNALKIADQYNHCKNFGQPKQSTISARP